MKLGACLGWTSCNCKAGRFGIYDDMIDRCLDWKICIISSTEKRQRGESSASKVQTHLLLQFVDLLLLGKVRVQCSHILTEGWRSPLFFQGYKKMGTNTRELQETKLSSALVPYDPLIILI
jgi:hypothetical protein